MAVKYPYCGDVESLQVPRKPINLKAMADLLEMAANLQRSAHSMILLAMVIVCLTFLAMFSVPVGLQSQKGYEGAREVVSGFRFRVFVILNAVSFFSSLGAVAVLILIQARGAGDVDMLLTCARAVYVAAGCATLAFTAAASTFAEPRRWL